MDKDSLSDTLPGNTSKSELLFLSLILRALDMGGRCAVIVPDGVLFGSYKAHIAIRKKMIEENRLDGVISMPSGVFKPYAGVSTAVLLFTKGATTERIWYYDMAHDGFSLDDKRQPVAENDIPDILECWRHRHDPDFAAERGARLDDLTTQLAPLKEERLRLEGEINRLTFEQTIAPESDRINGSMEAVKEEMAALDAQIAPLQAEIEQLTRQFWVTPEQVAENNYDLSASRYHQVAQDDVFYEKPDVTMDRLLRLEEVLENEIITMKEMLGD